MKLKNISLYNYFHYYAFLTLIILLTFESFFYIGLIVPFILLTKTYKNKGLLFLYGLIVTIFIFGFHNIEKPKPTEDIFQVIEVKAYEYNNQYTVKQGLSKYLFYSNEMFNIGDYVRLDYNVKTFKPERMPYGFNQKHYYGSKHIYYLLDVKASIYIKNGFHINQFKYRLMEKFNHYPELSKSYIYAFVFGKDIFDESFQDAKTTLGIHHLFALSGMHINLLIGFIILLFKWFKKETNPIIITIVLVVYLYLSSSSYSLLRAVLMYLFLSLFKKKVLTALDALSIAFITLIIYNPNARYNTGFVLSFLVSFFIVTLPEANQYIKLINIHVIAYFSSFLIVSNINGGFYLLSLFTSIIFTTIFPFILIVIFVSLIPKVTIVTNIILKYLNVFIENISFSPFIKIAYQPRLIIGLYLLLFIWILLANKKNIIKRLTVFLIFIIGVLFSNYLNPTLRIDFLDVGQGDTTLIQNAYNKGVILIDAHKGTTNYLNKLGPIQIDYLFITHGDYDHASEAEEIINSFNVKNIIISPYDDSTITKRLKSFGAKATKAGDVFICGEIYILVLGPIKRYVSINNNSLVLMVMIDNESYLFTGDSEKEAEIDLINTYKNRLKSDVLHVSHHGSNSGTTNLFLNYVSPNEAIISVGENNIYNHPHKELIERLNKRNIKVILTSENQTITKTKFRKYRKTFYTNMYKL